MLRLAGPLSGLVGLLLLLVGAAPAAAQEGTPAGDGDAEAEFAPLAFALLDEAPAAPAFFALGRITIEPGAANPPIALGGPLVGVIEAGTLAAQPNGPVSVQRAAAAATPGPAEIATPYIEFELGPGDQIVTPAGTGVAYYNIGDEPASALIVALLPADEPLPTAVPAGVTTEFLASGVMTELPAAPLALAMARLTYAPGQADPAPSENPGPLLAHVESGTFGYTVASGESQVTRAGVDGTPVAAPAATPAALGEEVTLAAGDALFEQGGTTSSGRNPGEEPAVVLVAVVGPAEEFAEEEGSPAAGTPAP